MLYFFFSLFFKQKPLVPGLNEGKRPKLLVLHYVTLSFNNRPTGVILTLTV